MGSKSITLNGVRYHYLDQGEGERVVLLLHGMPDTSAVWRHQIEALVPAGYRVIAPDLLGYGQTDKPQDPARYRGEALLADLIALLEALQLPRVEVVGHDWGAYASWELVLALPDRFRRHIALSTGHPDVMTSSSDVAEVKASWYMYLNGQTDAAALYLANDGDFFKRIIIPTHPEIEEVWSRVEDPAAMTAMLNWDKANPMAAFYLSSLAAGADQRRCRVPTLGIWSRGDTYLWESQMQRTEMLMDAAWSYECTGGSHWMMLDEHAVVSRLMLAWLAAS